jgi:nitroreductase
MDVRDAVASRFSCRAFLPTPVPLATVREILAALAPSGGNLQPWRVHALAGAVLAELEARIRPHAPANPRGEGSEYPVYPSPLKEPYNAAASRSARRSTAQSAFRVRTARRATANTPAISNSSAPRSGCFSPSTAAWDRRNGPTSACMSRP